MALAGLFAAASMAGFGLSRSYPAYCAASFLSGMGFGFGSMIPIAILLGRWFRRRRTLAVSLCHASSGIATLGIPSLIASSVENYGLPVTFFGEGALICALTALSFLLVRDRPDGVRSFPYGGDPGPAREPSSGKRAGIGGTDWLLIVPALLMTGAVTSVGFGHLSMLAASNGFRERTAALVVTVAGLMLMVGKAGFGVLSERYTTFRANRVFSAVLLISLAAFSFPIRSTALLMLSTALYGAGISMTAVGTSVWAGDLSAEQDYDRNVRRFQVAYSAGCLLFASVPGILADAAGGSYLPAFRMLLAFAACSMLIVQFLYRACRKRSR
jgi:predicted MFS family arabinose efflux permease